MVGLSSSSTVFLTNCLFAPSSLTMNHSNGYVFVSGSQRGNLTNCYYNDVTEASVLQKEGTDASAMSNQKLMAALGFNWQESGEIVVPKLDAPVLPHIIKPLFTGIIVSNSTTNNEVSFTGGKFTGSYSPVLLTPNDRSSLFLGAENKLYWPNAANNADGKYHLGACRAYFQLADGQQARSFVLNFGDGVTTPLLSPEGEEVSARGGLVGWYTLDGRKLDKKPTTKGLYIHNGRKVVIK